MISRYTRIIAVVAALLTTSSIFLPIWRIELDAPQYPEGLVLTIHADKLAGDVDIINGLNHYIGMETLHAENFIEFTILPYILGVFALLFFLIVFVRRNWYLYTMALSFLSFGIIALIDFWRWEYNYGHNLDPNAAIIIPGMAYQPPLIGFKQLLNFGAYSIPDIGGWLLLVSGILIFVAASNEMGFTLKILNLLKKNKTTMLLLLILFSFSCNNNGPYPITLNKTKCDHCQMTIADGRFASQLVTKKGRVYNFDDVSCLIGYESQNENIVIANRYICNYTSSNQLLPVENLFYVSSDLIKSPMRGNIAAFDKKENADEAAVKWNSSVIQWADVIKILQL